MDITAKFISHLQFVRGNTQSTLKNYHIDLTQFRHFVELCNYNMMRITFIEIERFMEFLKKRQLKNSSILRKIAALRSFYRWLYSRGKVRTNPFGEMKIHLKKEVQEIQYIEKRNMYQILHDVNHYSTDPFLNLRNQALLEFLYATGCRISEALGIDIKDLNLAEKIVLVNGKGAKQRRVYFNDTTREILLRYIDLKKKFFPQVQFLFVGIRGNRLSKRAVKHLLDRLSEKMNLQPHIRPHMIRHSFATHMACSGINPFVLKQLLGHESLNSTQIYTHMPHTTIRSEYNKHHPRAHGDQSAFQIDPMTIHDAAKILGHMGGIKSKQQSLNCSYPSID